MQRAHLVVTPTDAMREMILDRYPALAVNRFRTLYHGFSKKSLTAPNHARDPRPPFSIGEGTTARLFYPTHAAPHKGFDVLLGILIELKKRGLDFFLYTTAAESDWPTGMRTFTAGVAEAGLEKRVLLMGPIAQDEIGQVYESADLILFPSLCESFGFPLVEAMAFGIPIVAAGTPTNRELCGEAALYYTPEDPKEAARMVLEALRPDVSQQLVRAAEKRHAPNWGWDAYAGEFVQMLRDVTGAGC